MCPLLSSNNAQDEARPVRTPIDDLSKCHPVQSNGSNGADGRLFHLHHSRKDSFSGRERMLSDLRESFLGGVAVQALCGTDGKGKSTVAVEYAYRHRDDYDVILRAGARSEDRLITEFTAIAGVLDLPERRAEYMSLAVGAVLRWLASNSGWLLILDDIDDPVMARAYATFSDKGHVLLTTENSKIGEFARMVEVGEWSECEASPIVSSAKFGRAFDALEAQSHRAADLLRLSVFLDNESIPIELFEEVEANQELLRSALESAESSGLLEYHRANSTVALHRLVQEMLLARMSGDEVSHWIERAITAVDREFPDGKPDTWEICDRLLPHAAELSDHCCRFGLRVSKAALLMSAVAFYLERRGQVDRAGQFYRNALSMLEAEKGQNHPDLVTILNNLGLIYESQGRYKEAERLMQRALTVREISLGPAHPSTQKSLGNLAFLFCQQGRLDEAESLTLHGIAVLEREQGELHPSLVPALVSLADLYLVRLKYASAEALCERALSILERASGRDNAETANILDTLATIYSAQSKYLGAELLFARALSNREAAYGEEHPEVALSLSNLAGLCASQKRLVEASQFYARAVSIYEKTLGPVHGRTIGARYSYDSLMSQIGK